MSLTAIFSPPVTVELLDGGKIKFARVGMRHIAQFGNAMREERLPKRLAAIDADENLSVEQKHLAKMRAQFEVIGVGEVRHLFTTDPEKVIELLEFTALQIEGQTPEHVAAAIEQMDPDVQQVVAQNVIYQPILTKSQIAKLVPFNLAAILEPPTNPDMDGIAKTLGVQKENLVAWLTSQNQTPPTNSNATGSSTAPISSKNSADSTSENSPLNSGSSTPTKPDESPAILPAA